MPLSLVPELAKLDLRTVNFCVITTRTLLRTQKVESLSKIILPSSAQVCLISLNGFRVTKVLIEPEQGTDLENVKQTFKESLDNLFQIMDHDDDWQDHNASVEMLTLTRSRKRVMESDNGQSKPTLTPGHSS
jgi:hypothetical protein